LRNDATCTATLWCAAEYVYISVPDAVLPEMSDAKGQLLRAIGLRRADINQPDGAGPGYVSALLFTMVGKHPKFHGYAKGLRTYPRFHGQTLAKVPKMPPKYPK
jgi:hypothetical protein